MSLEKLWDDLMLEPPIKLYDLMSRVKKYAQLKDGARLAEHQGVLSSRGKSSFKCYKESVEEH